MQVKLLNPNDRPRWQNYISKNPKATFYHRIEWKDVIEKSFQHSTYYLLAMEENNVKGVLPLVQIKSCLFGKIICSMPFLNFGGLCADRESAHQVLIDEAKKIMEKSKSDYVEFRHLYESPLNLKRKKHKVSMTLELNSDPEVLWKNFKTKHRTNIRRAAKHGFKIVRGGKEYLDDFYNIISIGWRDLGVYLSGVLF